MTLQMVNVLETILKQSVDKESQRALHELQVSCWEDLRRLAVLCKPRRYAFLMIVICYFSAIFKAECSNECGQFGWMQCNFSSVKGRQLKY